MAHNAVGHIRQAEKLKFDCADRWIPCFKSHLPSVCRVKPPASGTERTEASKRWQEVWFIPLSPLTVAVDSSLQQSVQSQSRRHESGKTQTKTEISFQPYFQKC